MNTFNEIESRVIENVTSASGEILNMADYNKIQKYPRITQSLVKSLAPKTFEASKPIVIRFGPIAYSVDDEDEDKVEDIIDFNYASSPEIVKLNNLHSKEIKIKIFGNITLLNSSEPYPTLYLKAYKDIGGTIKEQWNIPLVNDENKPENNFINYEKIRSDFIFNSLNNMKLVHIWNDNNRIESLSNLYIEFRYEGTKSTNLDIPSSILFENPYIEIRHPKNNLQDLKI